MSRHEGLLLAGALLRSGDEAGADAPLEPLRARRYRHPALGARTVVRLAGETAAPGEDGALAFLGFEPPEATEPLARALRRGLGFPQWVLVNDPEHAAEALAVVDDMARAAHLARSRPGAANNRYQELARRLPYRHRPSFWEQAGRAFIAAGHLRYAAIAFEKAREAERVYALPVHEASRREVFLEFAFAGALTARSLAGYAAELRRRHPAEQAYEAFCELALRRTIGGLPPWTDLPEQIRRLAGEAGRDQAAATEQVLRDLLALPATRRAPAGFWRRSRSTLVAMGRASATLRGTLLNLFPTPGGEGDAGFAAWWLDLLEEAGALDALVLPAGQVPAEAAPARGAADWLARFLAHPWRGRWWHEPHPPARLYPLLARMAPRLRADNRPVVLPSSRWRRTLNVNVADACLEHGIPLADPPEHVTIDLDEWLRSQADGGVRRPLVHAAADPRFRPLLAAAVPAWSSRVERPADALLVSEPLEQVVRWWFEEQAAAVGGGGLLQATRRLQELARSSGPRTLARFPSAHATLTATSLVAPLARTLRAGLLDELGWPALEEAAAELEPLGWSASWPVLVLWNSRKAIAVGPTGRVAEHALRIPPGKDRAPSVLYAGGQFVVCWAEQGRQLGYWSAAPEERFPAGNVAAWWQEHNCPCGFAFLLPDGGRVAGRRALYPGDRTLPVGSAHLLWDGHTFWAVEQERDRAVLRELDPSTGGRGRRSLPSFLEDHAAPGETPLGELCSLAPLPGGLAGTPLGQRGGLVGFRVATAATAGRPSVWVEGVDGRRLQAPTPARAPVALVALPGTTSPRLLSGGGDLELWDPDLLGPLGGVAVGQAGPERRAFSGRLPTEGTPFGLPPAFWHCLVARDERGSHALRGVDDEAAGELLSAALVDLKGRLAPPPEAMGRTAAAVSRLLPEVCNERLLRGLLGTVRRAAELELRRGDLTGARATARRRTPGPGESSAPGRYSLAPPDAPLDEEALAAAISGWDGGRASYQVRHMVATPVAGQIQLLGRFFAGQVEADALAPALWAPAFPWPQLLGRVGALAFLAVSPLLGERSRAALLALLELWAEQPFAVDPGSFRVGYLEGAAKTAGRSPRGAYVVLADSPSWLLPGGRHRAGTFLERPTGTATALPPEANVAETRRVEAGWGTPAQLAAFARLVRERGPLPWDPAVPEALAARTGLTRAEATLLWAGLPYLDTWGSDFLGPEPRRLLGLTLGEAKTARDALRRVGDERRFGLLHAAMPDDPARLWAPLGNGPDDESSPVGRLAAAWVGRFGRRVRPPEDAVVEAAALDRPTPASELLATLLEPVAVPALVRDRDCWIAAGRHGEVALAAGDGMAEAMTRLVGDLAAAIPWAFAARPVGDPLRARLPELLALVRDRLRHPGLLLAAAHCYVEDPGQLVRRLFGSAPYKGRNGAGFPGQSADDGLTIAVVVSGWSLELFFRPALLGDDARSQVLRAQLEQPGWPAGSVAAVDLLHSEGYAAMAGRVRTTPVPEGAFEANPALSAPEVVTAARDTLGLSEDAAVLYLQLLALLEPTDRNLRRWNGWTPARHRRAAAELLRTSLVVEARRERARRPLFVPGEWVPAAAPNLPLEAWKLPLYCLTRHPSDGRPRSPIGRFLPLTPLHQIFAAAWGRLQGGDRPGGAG